MRDSKILIQIRLLCKILIRRLEEGEEIEVKKLCLEYFSPKFDDPFLISSLPQEFETTFTVFYAILICLALTSNFLALWLMFKRKSKSYHNSMVVSLTVSSFMLVAFCMPFNISLISNPFWNSDSVQCKVAIYLQNVAVISAMLAPVFIATKRYQAILRPLQFRSKTNTGSNFFALIFIWSLAIVVSLPNVYWFREINVHNIKTQDHLRSRILNSNSLRSEMKKSHWRTSTTTFHPFWHFRTSSTTTPSMTTDFTFTRPSKKTIATTASTRYMAVRSTTSKSTTTEHWQVDEQFIGRNICVHSLEHKGHILFYRSIIVALFFTSFTAMSFTYSAISYRLFRRSKSVENQSHTSFCCHSNFNPHLNICYHIPNQTPAKNPFTLTLMPHFVFQKEQNCKKLSRISKRNSCSNIATGYPKDVNRFYVENETYRKECKNEMANEIFKSTEVDVNNEISQKYLTAWRSSILFGAIALTYLLSWSPITIFELSLSTSVGNHIDVSSSRHRYALQYLACINSCLNPFLYIILHDFNKLQLKEYIKEKRKCWRAKKLKSNKVEPGEQADDRNSFSLPIQEPTQSQRVDNPPRAQNFPRLQWMMLRRQESID